MVGHRPGPTWLAAGVVGALALATMATGMTNGFAYDDVALLVNDPRLHDLPTLPARLLEPYWPSGLYRPVTLGALGLEWIAGGGSPLLFRVVSALLYAAVSMAAFRLAVRAGAPPVAALLGGLVFAAHPVHSEVTANTVGQAELLSALFALMAVGWYLRARQAGGLSWADTLAVALLGLSSALAKETGYVVPGLLVAAEVMLVRDPAPWRQRLARLRPAVLIMAAAFLGALALRVAVLGGLGGETAHRALVGVPAAGRATAMLAIVPEWARLLFWPARLQADYGPPGLAVITDIGPAHLAGAALLAGGVAVMLWCLHRAPLVAFGVAWTGIALAPVANVVFPTGILLAERTLFLPSVGLALAVAGVAAMVGPRLARRPAVRGALAGLLLVLVAAGALHSARRQPAWRDTLTILERTARDAPTSYRAFLVLGKERLHRGDRAGAAAAFRQATVLYGDDPRPFEELGQLLRIEGRCDEAVPVLAAGVSADSTSDVARSRLIECLIMERRWEEAEMEIARGLAQGVTSYRRPLERVEAGRAREAAPPP